MKKQFLFTTVVLMIIFSACSTSQKDKIVGKWKLTKVGTETLSSSEVNASIEFTKDGKMMIVVDGDSAISKWELSKDEKSIELISKKNNQKKNWNIVALSEHQLVYTPGSDTSKITLTK